jgi:hypothetical protein
MEIDFDEKDHQSSPRDLFGNAGSPCGRGLCADADSDTRSAYGRSDRRGNSNRRSDCGSYRRPDYSADCGGN